MLDQQAMRSILNLQIDVDNTTKSRIVLSYSYQTKIPYNPLLIKVGHSNVKGHHDMRRNWSHIKGTLNVV